MITFPINKIQNKEFATTLTKILGSGWTVKSENENWVITPSPEFSFNYFSEISRVHFKKKTIAKDLFKALVEIDDVELHEKYLSSQNDGETKKLHISTVFGMNARLYAGNSLFFLNTVQTFDKTVSNFIEEMQRELKLEQAIIYKKNFQKLITILTLKRFAFNFSKTDIPGGNDRSSFWGAIPSAFEFSNYLDPFLIFAPIHLAIPLDRFTSGAILIPKETFNIPWDGNTSFSEIFLKVPSGITRSTYFSIFGSNNHLSKIDIRRHVNYLLKALNDFLDWMVLPQTSLNSKGVYDPGFGLQLVATTNSIMTSFIYCGRCNETGERIGHIFNAFDRFANLAVHLFHFRNGLSFDDTTRKEKSKFEKLFTKEFNDFSQRILLGKIENKKICTLLRSATNDALKDIEQSVAVLDGNLGAKIRVFRNLSHGAFLKRAEFLKTFSHGDVRLSGQFPVLLYSYMLAFVSDPEMFIMELGKD
jgi:hypothetical protein